MSEYDTDKRTLELVREIEALREVIEEQEKVIQRHESDKHNLVVALNNIMMESFK